MKRKVAVIGGGPAGCSTANLLQAAGDGALSRDETVVCVITGMGLKDMDAARAICEQRGTAAPRPVGSLAESLPYLED